MSGPLPIQAPAVPDVAALTGEIVQQQRNQALTDLARAYASNQALTAQLEAMAQQNGALAAKLAAAEAERQAETEWAWRPMKDAPDHNHPVILITDSGFVFRGRRYGPQNGPPPFDRWSDDWADDANKRPYWLHLSSLCGWLPVPSPAPEEGQ